MVMINNRMFPERPYTQPLAGPIQWTYQLPDVEHTVELPFGANQYQSNKDRANSPMPRHLLGGDLD